MSDTLPKTEGHSRQFSMRAMMITVTLFCVVLAVPQGWVLIVAIFGWAALTALVAWPMVVFYRPIYQFIASAPKTTDERTT